MAYLYQYVDREPVRQAHPAAESCPAHPDPDAIGTGWRLVILALEGVILAAVAWTVLVLFLITFGV